MFCTHTIIVVASVADLQEETVHDAFITEAEVIPKSEVSSKV